MEEKDELFKYMNEMKKLGQYLAVGYNIETTEDEIISLDRNMALYQGAFSILNEDKLDPLSRRYLGEYDSIQCMTQLMTDGYFAPEDFDASMFIKLQSEEDAKIYRILNERLRQLLNVMVMQLYAGLKIPLNMADVEDILAWCVGEEGEVLMEEIMEEIESGGEGKRDKSKLYLTYDSASKKFILFQDDEIMLDDVDVEMAIEKTSGYLYTLDRRKKQQELTGGKIMEQPTYREINIDDDGER